MYVHKLIIFIHTGQSSSSLDILVPYGFHMQNKSNNAIHVHIQITMHNKSNVYILFLMCFIEKFYHT